MAAVDYASLQAEIANWLHRTDLTLSIPNFIYYAETNINNRIKSFNQQLTITGTMTTDANGVYCIQLPSDYGMLLDIVINANGYFPQLKPLNDIEFNKYNGLQYQDSPRFYNLQNTSIAGVPTTLMYFAPLSDSAYTYSLTYFQQVSHLSAVNLTNWVLTNYPKVYLYGSLIEACIYIEDFEALDRYQLMFDKEIEDIWKNSAMKQFSGAPLQSYSDYIM